MNILGRFNWLFALALATTLVLTGPGQAGPDATTPTAAAAPAGNVDADWLARVQRAIAEGEYQASRNDAGLQAPNRAHRLRTWFAPEGARVVDREAEGAPLLLKLRLVGLGRGKDLAEVMPGEVTHDGNRITIRRPELTEWYVNTAQGLEQGFTLAKRPAGAGPLALELAVDPAQASGGGDTVNLRTPAGRQLRYAKLLVRDAADTVIPAYFEVPDAAHLRVVVDDADAAYPLVIDPLLTATADATLESDDVGAMLGESVAGAGDVNGDGYADVVIGAPQYDAGEPNEGAVFVFHGSTTGIDASMNPGMDADTYIQSNQAGALLGASVAGAGDVNGDGYADLIVGAYVYNGNGAAFVFHGTLDGIVAENPTVASTRLESDQAESDFGRSVAGAGDVNGDGYADVVVGAPRYNNGPLIDVGIIAVFYGSTNGIDDGSPNENCFMISTGLVPDCVSGENANDRLGESVAGAGDVNGDGNDDIVYGAPGRSAAWVSRGNANGIDPDPGTEIAWTQPGPETGVNVAGAGDVNGDGYADILVGAPEYESGSDNEGEAWLFVGGADGIATNCGPVDPDVCTPDESAVSLAGNDTDARAGSAVAGAGDVNGDGYADVVIVSKTSVVTADAFVFLGDADASLGCPGSPPRCQIGTNNGNSTQIGDVPAAISDVASAGDVNGDGYADLLAGASSHSTGGGVFVYHGGGRGLVSGNETDSAAQFEANRTNAYMGYAAGAGDVNGDGYSDLLIGADGYDFGGNPNQGAVFVYLGGRDIADGNPDTAQVIIVGNNQDAKLGYNPAGAGDVNGDGFADIIVGARYRDAETVFNATNAGAAYVFHGSVSGIDTQACQLQFSPPVCTPDEADFAVEADQANAELGWSVAGAGDVNGDGFADVIVGAPAYDTTADDAGVALVFLGGPAGLAEGLCAPPAYCLPGQADTFLASGNWQSEGTRLGSDVAGAGDVNGDGYADIIVVAEGRDQPSNNEGVALVFHGSAQGIASIYSSSNIFDLADTRIESDQSEQEASDGHRPAAGQAGDVNGDGFGDVIIGWSKYNSGLTDEGEAWVFLGGPTGVRSRDGSLCPNEPEPGPVVCDADDAVFQMAGNDGGAWLGFSVAGAGDVNADGYADVLIGARNQDAGTLPASAGEAYLFLGHPDGIDTSNCADAVRCDRLGAAARINMSNIADNITSVAGAGDVNGDGFADILIGSTGDGDNDEGRSHLFLGNANLSGREVLANQQRDGGSALIVPWGATMGAFQVSIEATHPGGRGAVKAEVEYCPPSVPFGDASCGSQIGTEWYAITPDPRPSVELVETVSGLEDALYRWRARVLHAPAAVINQAIMAPPAPAHGPWRRVHAQSTEADIRVMVDTDGDEIGDGVDNCTLLANPDQRDTNNDGFGNLCDPDLNNDCDVNFLDLGALKAAFFSTPADLNWSEDADLNGDGNVNFLDLGIMKSQFFEAPGPSANACNVLPPLTQVFAEATTVTAIGDEGGITARCPVGQKIGFGWTMQTNDGGDTPNCLKPNNRACTKGQNSCSLPSCASPGNDESRIYILCTSYPEAFATLDVVTANGDGDAISVTCAAGKEIAWGWGWQQSTDIDGDACLKSNIKACPEGDTNCSQIDCNTTGNDENFLLVACDTADHAFRTELTPQFSKGDGDALTVMCDAEQQIAFGHTAQVSDDHDNSDACLKANNAACPQGAESCSNAGACNTAGDDENWIYAMCLMPEN